jgi:tRNA nucleotidyltransferase (CCA-adding enzyme)
MRLEEEVVRRIHPSEQLVREVDDVAGALLKMIKDMTAGRAEVKDVQLVGSVAKHTYVGRPDIDLFILFDVSTPRSRMNEIGLGVGKTILPVHEERYAEHPYVHGRFEGFEVDIVPCYGVDDPSNLQSAVDRTPFHTRFIMERMTPVMRDQVRLLKQFMKGIGIYGAEAKVQGFSGYLVELMVIKYGSFHECLEASSRWKFGTKVSLNGNITDKFQAPLVFIDPVDKSRNVASALSLDQFSKFVFASQEFLDNPDEKFFFPHPRRSWDGDVLRNYFVETGFKTVLVKCPRPSEIDDNVFPQARKSLEGLRVLLEQAGFRVMDKALSIGSEVNMVFLLESDIISDCHKHVGPPVWMDTSKDFLERWKGASVGEPFIEGGRWVVIIHRDCNEASSLLRMNLSKASLGSSFKELSFEIFRHEEALSDDNRSVLTDLIDKRMPWTR